MSDEIKSALASESAHWYTKQGEPAYEVPTAKGIGFRPTTLADARKLDLVPSVTTILACAAKPGLEAWKARQILEAALTLPMQQGESLDDYASRVIEDSKAQGRKAAERGTDLHAAIETYIQIGSLNVDVDKLYGKHCCKVQDTLKQYGIDIFQGNAEHSFASQLGYGGKIDWHNDEIICDFKTKANLSAKQLAYPEHCWQLAAYWVGLRDPYKFGRLINVFIGVDDCKVRIHEWTEKDAAVAWNCFYHLQRFWQLTKNWKQNP